MSDAMSVAATLARHLKDAGVRRMFGVPGGGSSLDLIDAAARLGIEFVLARSETAAAIMAATTAEITGAPGVVLTGLGPGTASAVNGIAHAALDRAAVILLADCLDPIRDAYVTHQAIDQIAIFRPIVKTALRLTAATAHEIPGLIARALAPPAGPVHIELAPSEAMLPVSGRIAPALAPDPSPIAPAVIAEASALLRGARRPVILAGLDSRGAAPELRRLAEALACPVLVTYKAKGAFADTHPLFAGVFTGGAAEADCVAASDLIIGFGLDPVELIPQRWRYRAPFIALTPWAGPPHYTQAAIELAGPIAPAASALAADATRSVWPAEEIAELRTAWRALLSGPRDIGRNLAVPIAPQELVEAAAAAAPAGTRATVDAGAHMVPATSFWPAAEPGGLLISNGLSTMGFALPAAIAAALAEPARPVIAFTGDAGLMMCLAELSTASRLGLHIVVCVFNDAALSLIDIKQQARGMASAGVRYAATDFAALARGMGCAGMRVADRAELGDALRRAFAAAGPVVLDVAIDPSGYPAQLAALRG